MLTYLGLQKHFLFAIECKIYFMACNLSELLVYIFMHLALRLNQNTNVNDLHNFLLKKKKKLQYNTLPFINMEITVMQHCICQY